MSRPPDVVGHLDGGGVRVHLRSAKMLYFRGFDSSIILNSRGGIVRSIRNFPECLSQAILLGMMITLIGRVGAPEGG